MAVERREELLMHAANFFFFFLPTHNTASATDWEPFFFIAVSLAQQGTGVRASPSFPLMSWFDFVGLVFDCKTHLFIPVSPPRWHSCAQLACRYHVYNRACLFCAWERTVTLERTLPTTLLLLFPKVMKCGPASFSYHLSILPFGFCMLLHITHRACFTFNLW